MTRARSPAYADGWPPGVTPPPRGKDLPFDDGAPMESPDHRHQMNLLVELFTLALDRPDAFVGGNHALYYSARQAQQNDFRAPDVFVVLDAIDNPDRRSWVVWEEDGRMPNVVVELLSESTEANDVGPKKRIYEQVLRVRDYYVYDPIDHRFMGWHLESGAYEPIAPDAHGRLYCREVGLLLGRWRGRYLNRENTWLRLFTLDGALVPTGAEREAARAEAEAARANAAEARVQELLAELARRGGGD